jgi:hypothetical protein
VDLLSRKKSVREEDMRKIGIHPLVKVGSLGEEVCNHVQHAGDMLKCIIEVL